MCGVALLRRCCAVCLLCVIAGVRRGALWCGVTLWIVRRGGCAVGVVAHCGALVRCVWVLRGGGCDVGIVAFRLRHTACGA